jgi:hypothetical protein
MCKTLLELCDAAVEQAKLRANPGMLQLCKDGIMQFTRLARSLEVNIDHETACHKVTVLVYVYPLSAWPRPSGDIAFNSAIPGILTEKNCCRRRFLAVNQKTHKQLGCSK